MPHDPCWQESSWGRGVGPARVDGIDPPERDERKWGLQTLLLKSFAEKLSAKKTELMFAIMSMKNCFLVLGFFFSLNTGFWGCFWFVSFGTFGLFFSMWNLSSTARDGIQPPALAA